MIIVVTGPTGVGKTKLSINLAKKYNAEVINADAIQRQALDVEVVVSLVLRFVLEASNDVLELFFGESQLVVLEPIGIQFFDEVVFRFIGRVIQLVAF